MKLTYIHHIIAIKRLLAAFLNSKELSDFSNNLRYDRTLWSYLTYYVAQWEEDEWYEESESTWMDDVINHAFTWANTPQGRTFWADKHLEWKEFVQQMTNR